MPFKAYAFKIGQDAFLLDEEEWRKIAPLLENRIERIKKQRQETGCSIEDASKDEPAGQAALDQYEHLTGLRLDHPDQLWGVRMKDYGALCPNCCRPFRTLTAKLCAECGFELPAGTQAGELGA